MREILFRGKNNEGKWIEGDLYQSRLKSVFMISQYTQYGNRMTEVVNPETVSEFTGLTDKNGKKIFEGDIVKCSDETYGYGFVAVVMFGNPNGEYNWGFQLKRIRGASANTDILLWVDMEESGAYIEVIGNIHDNPELLKGGD